jgi:putative ABC transport system permease protein
MTRSEFGENLGVALDALRAHKVRSGLTILGIIIGVTSVISVAAIIDGLNAYVQRRVASFGARSYFISRRPPGIRFGTLTEELRKRKYLDYSDAAYLRERCQSVETVSPFTTRAFFLGDSNEMRYGSERVERLFLRGVEPEYVEVFPLFQVAQGRFVSRNDQDHARPVVVIGAAIADSLFATVDPIGRMAYLNGKQYEVIGVLEQDSGFFGGPGADQFALIPLSEFKKRYPESKEILIGFTVSATVNPQQGIDEVTEAMRRRRRVPADKPNDFDVVSPDFISSLWNQLTGALVVLTGVISSVGLLVGGIGVMNIMLISVTERTMEIGVRKAIGARSADVRVQFLLEAVILTSTGGVLGVLLGAIVTLVIRSMLPTVPAAISAFWVVAGVAMSVGVGIFFGYYPANRAAQLDPITCLRYE